MGLLVCQVYFFFTSLLVDCCLQYNSLLLFFFIEILLHGRNLLLLRDEETKLLKPNANPIPRELPHHSFVNECARHARGFSNVSFYYSWRFFDIFNDPHEGAPSTDWILGRLPHAWRLACLCQPVCVDEVCLLVSSITSVSSFTTKNQEFKNLPGRCAPVPVSSAKVRQTWTARLGSDLECIAAALSAPIPANCARSPIPWVRSCLWKTRERKHCETRWIDMNHCSVLGRNLPEDKRMMTFMAAYSNWSTRSRRKWSVKWIIRSMHEPSPKVRACSRVMDLPWEIRISPGVAIERKQQAKSNSSHHVLINREIWSSICSTHKKKNLRWVLLKPGKYDGWRKAVRTWMFLNSGRLLHHLTIL